MHGNAAIGAKTSGRFMTRIVVEWERAHEVRVTMPSDWITHRHAAGVNAPMTNLQFYVGIALRSWSPFDTVRHLSSYRPQRMRLNDWHCPFWDSLQWHRTS